MIESRYSFRRKLGLALGSMAVLFAGIGFVFAQVAQTSIGTDVTVANNLTVIGTSTLRGINYAGSCTANDGDGDNSVTCDAVSGTLTTKSLTTASPGLYTLLVVNNKVTANSHIFVSVQNGTNTQGGSIIGRVTPTAGSFTVEIHNPGWMPPANVHNGTLVLHFTVSEPLP